MQINVIHMYDHRSIISRHKNNNHLDFYTLYRLKMVISRPLKVW